MDWFLYDNGLRHERVKYQSFTFSPGMQILLKRAVSAEFWANRLCQSLFFNKFAGLACNFIKKETLSQGFARNSAETVRFHKFSIPGN